MEISTTPELFARAVRSMVAGHEPDAAAPSTLYESVIGAFAKPLITEILQLTGGNELRAAAILGINRGTLRKKRRLLGVAG